MYSLWQYQLVAVWILAITPNPDNSKNSQDTNLVINEVMPSNDGYFHDLYGNSSDWVELFNPSQDTIDLSNYYFSDDLSNLTKTKLNSNSPDVKLAPGSFLILWADENPDLGPLHINLKLNKDAETFFIVAQDGKTIIDQMTWKDLKTNRSIGKSPTSGKTRTFEEPTPLLPNLPIVKDEVEFSLPGGYHDGIQKLRLVTTNGIIRYTVDGSEPNFSSRVFQNEITLDSTTLIKAKVFLPQKNPSETHSRMYLINESHTLPVVSISTDPDNLWSPSKGIYVLGYNGKPSHNQTIPANWNQNWEHPAQVEFIFQEDVIRSRIGIEISGQTSRSLPQKSLKLKWRNRFGDAEISYEFFEEKAIHSFTDLILRNGGNNFRGFMFKDALAHRVVAGRMDVDYQAFQPSVVYMNGQYWGIQNLRERINSNYLIGNHALPSYPINILENEYGVLQGDRKDFGAISKALNTASSEEEVHKILTQHIDVNEFINYNTTELFWGNVDWPINNVKYWNQPSYRKWRWIVADLDVSSKYDIYLDFNYLNRLQGGDYDRSLTRLLSYEVNDASNLVFRKLWEVQDLREQFIGVYQAHINTTFKQERVNQILNQILLQVGGEKEAHMQEWSLSEWDNDLEDLKKFIEHRPGFALKNLLDVVGTGELVNMSLAVDDYERGTIHINGVDMIPGDSQTNARFISSSPVVVEAISKPGYTFSHWTGVDYTFPQMRINPSDSLQLKAYFVVDDKVEEPSLLLFPNPATDMVYLEANGIKLVSPLQVQIFDQVGKVHIDMLVPYADSIEIAIDRLVKGVYILKIEDQNGHFFSKRFVKKSNSQPLE